MGSSPETKKLLRSSLAHSDSRCQREGMEGFAQHTGGGAGGLQGKQSYMLKP